MLAYIGFPVLVGLTVGFAFMNVAPVSQQFMQIFGINYTGLSILISAAPWSHATTQLLAGMVLDKMGLIRGMLLACFAAAILNTAPLLYPSSLWLAVAVRFFAITAMGLVFLAVFKVIGLLAPAKHTSLAQGLYGGAYGFGIVLPYFTLPYLGEYAWVWAYLITAGMCAAAGIWVCLLPHKEIASRQQSQQPKVAVKMRELLFTCARSPEVWMLGIFHGIFSGTLSCMGQWLPSFLSDLSGASTDTWAFAASGALILGACSRTASGVVSRVITRRWAIFVSLLLLSVIYIALGMNYGVNSGVILGIGVAASCGISYGAVFTLGAKVLRQEYMGTALGLLNSMANLTNAGLTLLLGVVRDTTGTFNVGFCIIGVFSFLVLVFSRRRIARLDVGLEKQGQ